MAEESEVIQDDLEETRSSLADKLSQLGDKVSGTVETVEETVEGVIETAEGAMETASETVEAVKDTFDLRVQMEERPWLILGGAALLGFLGGKLLFSGSSEEEPAERPRDRDYRRDSWESSWDSDHGRGHNGHSAADMTERMSAAAQPGGTADTQSQAESSQGGWLSGDWFGGITEKMQPEMDALKGLALGAVFGMVRDMVSNGLPDSLKSEVTNIFNGMAERAGGKPIQGSVMGSSESESEQEGEEEGADQESEGERSTEPRQQGKEGGKKRGKNHRFANR